MAAVESITKSLGLNYGLTGKAAAEAATNIVNLAGGIDQLSALSTQYYQSFYSETERQLMLQQQLAEQFAAINTTMPTTREGFRALVDAIDLTTAAGQAQFAALMQLVPGMDQYLQALESQRSASEAAAEAAQKEAEAKVAALKQQGLDLQLRLYDALGQSAEALALRRQMELAATDETLRAMLLSIYAAEDAATAQRELAAAQDAAASSARDAAAAALDAAQNAFGKLQESAQAEKDRLATELDLKLSAIDKEREALESQRDSVIAGYEQQSQAVEQYVSKLEGLNSVINGFLDSTSSAVDPFKRLTQIFNEAKAGLLPDQSELQSVLGAINSGGGNFGSAFEQQRAMAIARNQAQGIGGIVGGQLSGAKSQLQWIEMQTKDAAEYYGAQLLKLDQAAEQAQKLHDEQVAEIDKQLSEAQKQLNALLGIDDRMLTMSEALSEFYASLEKAQSLQVETGVTQIDAINRVESAILQVGQQIVEINKPLDRVWVPPTMPDRVTTDGSGMSAEVVALLKELNAAMEATAKHTKTSADALELAQFEAAEVAP
jgi:DNA-binding TFAR19-related protein (PDSD5 family)